MKMSDHQEKPMPETRLPPIRIAILATDGFEESELMLPRAALEKAGAKTILISPKDDQIQGMKHHDKSKKVDVDLLLNDANPDDYDAVLLPGGALNADALRVEKEAQEFVREIDRAGKPIAVICHGPWLLVSAGLVKGRTLTSYHTIQDDIRNAGGNWKYEEVVRDANWVSSRQPSDIPAFNREMLALFAVTKAKAKTA
jgi:protease I